MILVYSKPSRLAVDAEARDSKQTSPGNFTCKSEEAIETRLHCTAVDSKLVRPRVDPIPGVEVCPAMPQLSSLSNLSPACVFGQRTGQIYCFGLETVFDPESSFMSGPLNSLLS